MSKPRLPHCVTEVPKLREHQRSRCSSAACSTSLGDLQIDSMGLCLECMSSHTVKGSTGERKPSTGEMCLSLSTHCKMCNWNDSKDGSWWRFPGPDLGTTKTHSCSGQSASHCINTEQCDERVSQIQTLPTNPVTAVNRHSLVVQLLLPRNLQRSVELHLPHSSRCP